MAGQGSYEQVRVRLIRVPRWQIALIGAIAVAFLVTLAVLAASVFLVVFPIVVIAGLVWRIVAYLRGGRAPARSGPVEIEAEYKVVADRALEERRTRDRR